MLICFRFNSRYHVLVHVTTIKCYRVLLFKVNVSNIVMKARVFFLLYKVSVLTEIPPETPLELDVLNINTRVHRQEVHVYVPILI